MENQKIVLTPFQLPLVLNRLALQAIETHFDFQNTLIVGLQPRGVALAKLIHQIIESKIQKQVAFGILDFSLYRDDLHIQPKVMEMKEFSMPFSIEGKNVILIDDVLYTGRSVRSALDALIDFGRPNDIELMVLIDRRLHRNVPIQAKYVGLAIDSIQSEKVVVELSPNLAQSRVFLQNINPI